MASGQPIFVTIWSPSSALQYSVVERVWYTMPLFVTVWPTSDGLQQSFVERVQEYSTSWPLAGQYLPLFGQQVVHYNTLSSKQCSTWPLAAQYLLLFGWLPSSALQNSFDERLL